MTQHFALVSKVTAALSKHSQGLSKEYDVILSEISQPELSDEMLLAYLTGLKQCVTEMDRRVETLVGVILKVDWTIRGKTTVREYQSFLLNLVSAHTFYLKAVLRMIVIQLRPVVRSSRGMDREITEELKVQHNQSFFNLHSLLQAITKIVPMVPTVLLPLLVEKFPYVVLPGYMQQCYVRNLLQIAIYVAKLRPQILELIISNLTKLDVECPRDKIQAAAEDEEDEEDIFDMDGVTSSEPDGTSQNKMPSEAIKLDMLMEVILGYIHDTCYQNDELDWEVTKKFYKEFLAAFDKILLPTYASSHAQFIMFYICSFKSPLAEGFLDYLWKRVQDPNTESVFRQAAVAYIASLLARATYIPTSTVKAVLDLMATWVHVYIQQTADSSTRAEVKLHGTFYSVCQAIFYTLAFRHKELLDSKRGVQYCQRLNLQTIVTCRLNPLKFSLPIITNTFSCVARQHQLAFCDTIIERNKRNQLPVAASYNDTVSQHACVNTLHSFFPFDPYLLPRSGVYIHSLYKEYEGVTVEDDVDEDNKEEDQYMEVASSIPDVTDHIGLKILQSPTSPVITDFMMYGTSPGFKHA